MSPEAQRYWMIGGITAAVAGLVYLISKSQTQGVSTAAAAAPVIPPQAPPAAPPITPQQAASAVTTIIQRPAAAQAVAAALRPAPTYAINLPANQTYNLNVGDVVQINPPVDCPLSSCSFSTSSPAFQNLGGGLLKAVAATDPATGGAYVYIAGCNRTLAVAFVVNDPNLGRTLP